MWAKVGTSQMEDEWDERDAMDGLMDDERMRQLQEVGVEEEKRTVKRNAGREFNVERVQCAPELVMAQAHMKGIESNAEKTEKKKKKKVAAWSTKNTGGSCERTGI